MVDTKAGHFEPEDFVDHYEVGLVELLKTKQARLPAKKQPAPMMPRPSGANIFDLLRQRRGRDEREEGESAVTATLYRKEKIAAKATGARLAGLLCKRSPSSILRYVKDALLSAAEYAR